MEYYGNNDFRDYEVLRHHGILGMEWGKRNGPPYPLGSGDHSVSEKKAGWRKSLGGGRNESKYSRKRSSALSVLRRDKYQTQFDREKSMPKEKDSKKAEKKELTPEEKAARKELAKKIIIGAAISAGVGAGIYLAYKHASLEDMSKQGDELTEDKAKEIMIDNLGDQVLPKGAEIHRMVSEAGIDFSKVNTPTYASYKRGDVLTYRGYLTDRNDPKKQMYEVTFKAAQDIRMPTREKARQVFEELWNKDPSYKNELKETLTDALLVEYKKQMPNTPENIIMNRIVKPAVKKQLSNVEDAFDGGVYAIVKQQSDSKKLVGELLNKGYNAMIDYHDVDDGVAEAPLILFNPSSALVKEGEKAVTKAMRAKAIKEVQWDLWSRQMDAQIKKMKVG